MKAMFESLKLFIENFASYIIVLVRVSVVTPLDGDKPADAESSARDWGTGIDIESGEALTAYGTARRRTKRRGYVTSNGRGSLEIGGADD